MQFLENIKSSIYNPAYYSEILSKPFSYSLKYFLSLAALIALVTTIIVSFTTLPKINKAIGEIGSSALKYYPDNLEVTVKSGKVSTNVPEPYFIKMPAELKDEARGVKNRSAETTPNIVGMENLLVIDTISPLTPDLLRNYNTTSILSHDSFAYRDSNGAIKIQPLDQSLNGVVSKPKVSAALNGIMPYLKILPLVLVPIIFIFSLIGFVLGNLFYLIFGAFVIWIAAKIRNRNLEYSKAYQIGLHAITLGVILEVIFSRIYPIMEFPFLFTILMLAVIWVNLKFSSAADNPPPAPTGKPAADGKI